MKTTIRTLDPWADYKLKHCGCKDASSYNSCQGLANCSLREDHPERKTPPTVEQRSVRQPYDWSMFLVALAMAVLGFVAGVLLK